MVNKTVTTKIVVQLDDQFTVPIKEAIDQYVKSVRESAGQVAEAQPFALPPIPQNTVFLLKETKNYLEQIQNMQDTFITVNLIDNATREAKRVRKEIEAIFFQDINQRVRISQDTVSANSPFHSNKPDLLFQDGLAEFQSSSTDLTGFGGSVGRSVGASIPGFSSGIDRVPRDMLAMIHKDEAVLPKNQAEDFRRGGSSGITIQKLDFNFNVPNGLKLDREEFRNLAFQMRDELKRLDSRIN